MGGVLACKVMNARNLSGDILPSVDAGKVLQPLELCAVAGKAIWSLRLRLQGRRLKSGLFLSRWPRLVSDPSWAGCGAGAFCDGGA